MFYNLRDITKFRNEYKFFRYDLSLWSLTRIATCERLRNPFQLPDNKILQII
ncbi:hypothetical protein C2G38_2086124 [Gigaspora rosea]|uniref:Uncharacterized protein n=1 Tax=Gigaspora rosea TaxID=44941 RepID=A0A397V730_9GLOM|nr:hypothetical protein C2G38_2086124 [Gigaspora rosea]